jgi:primosomal protein N' (replication factor Y)
MEPPAAADPQDKSDGFLELFPRAPEGRIARVVSELALDKPFDYRIPPELDGLLRPGHLVQAPFRGRRMQGLVLEIVDHSEHPRLKTLEGLARPKPLVGEDILRLARWMAEYYAAPLEHALRAVLPAAVRKKEAKFKEQLFALRVAEAEAPAPGGRVLGEKQRAALEILTSGVPMRLTELAERHGIPASTLRALEKRGWVRVVREAVARDPLAGAVYLMSEPLALTGEQATAVARARQGIDTGSPRVILLHGVTGSGKTEVYLQAIQHALDGGKGAILLVPEIALTPQTVDRFKGRFGRRIAVLHSHLSDGERHDEWHRIREGDAPVVVGARSAVFAPVPRLGLIILDEEHEGTYKQDESPAYHARDVAIMRATFAGAAVLLGSATPSLESHHNAELGKFERVTLGRRVDDRSLPALRVVDMRKEVDEEGLPRLFSSALVDAIHLRLNRGEQVMLFRNRRGFSTSLTCPACATVVSCRQCSVALTHHRARGELRCHWCGWSEPVPTRCPSCQDPRLQHVGAGTEKVEDRLARLFPYANVLRMDSDSMTRKDSYRQAFQQFRTGKVDILLGTQMIAKGLDFPNVTLVGILSADAGLNLPDFRAAERTFQLLTQMSGRAGRGEVAGEVIVQTCAPAHPAVRCAVEGGYAAFAAGELAAREAGFYPPYSHLVVITARGHSVEKVEFTLDHLAARLRERLPAEAHLAGPQEAPIARLRGEHRRQLVLRARSAGRITRPLRELLTGFRPPEGVHVSADVDALDLL